ncbi:hypothetical protein Psal006b_03595 (plasmid) [Piscirickettsia salmonis]|uniref:Replication initiator protein A n=1 Tax=Piscirickettsia salmonis TaxID=1238 RepID=A0A1L6TID1_PISSA|nr:hypothetical protein [Piscirickettsia salmonis]ALB24358.1 Replication initiator protein A [Piscirickettsia salmonis]ALT18953.1 hypothetical protein PSLF89_08940 [Piscirickettsia salmonis LF-89 = ATCC VR-1361]ALY04329.1 hypothetical protein AWE47_17345 [Piscirickettsia salmonis]AMA44076.1 hypothetical protein AWJ11_17005 [Piscirickettsia salmonis]AOS36877.1 hypothetical protein AVM72_16000 [Piscirickettsia salmonis]
MSTKVISKPHTTKQLTNRIDDIIKKKSANFCTTQAKSTEENTAKLFGKMFIDLQREKNIKKPITLEQAMLNIDGSLESLEVLTEFFTKMRNRNDPGVDREYWGKLTTIFEKESRKKRNNVVIPFPDKMLGDKTAIPNAFIRSALFGAVRRGPVELIDIDKPGDEWPLIASWKNTEIRFRGFRLDGRDFDLWIAIVEAVKDQGFGSSITISLYGLLKISMLKNTKSNRDSLKKRLDKLFSAKVHVKVNNASYKGHMVDSIASDDESKDNNKYRISLNSDMIDLFAAGFTKQCISERRKLKGYLTKWMQLYVSSHEVSKKNSKKPHKISLEKLKSLYDPELEMRYFKRDLKDAIKQLNDSNMYHCSIEANNFIATP